MTWKRTWLTGTETEQEQFAEQHFVAGPIYMQVLFCFVLFILVKEGFPELPPPFLSHSIPSSKQKERPYFGSRLELNLGKQITNHIPKLGGTITHNSAETSPVGMQLPGLMCFLLHALFVHSLTRSLTHA